MANPTLDWHLVFRSDPYQGFPVEKYELDLQGWNAHPVIFDRLIAETQPHVVIEVGTWKGVSAILFADALKRQNLTGRVICVDTWLGALEFWTNEMPDLDRYAALALCHGYPQVYYQFLANVILSGHRDAIIPLPNTSQIAARFLRRHAIHAELIYIDASHDERDVYADLVDYWQLLNPNGIMFGDDFGNKDFPGVRSAVERFARERSLMLNVIGGWYWLLQYPQ